MSNSSSSYDSASESGETKNNIPIPKTPDEFFRHLEILYDAYYVIDFCDYMSKKTRTKRYNLSREMKNIMDIFLNHWLD